ncbi:hypothetical protein [Stagnimonas aquatica]|uniref:hypothetical protein n=1 Tax=Stagnimonas aquatica TaxID=2689987 RepID=UPI0011CEA15D|nr:hypothetical protein [Stagnimonas aquatica]
MLTSFPRFTRVLTAAVLSAGFIASAHARPTDLDWKPGIGAVVTQTATAPQRNLGAPFYGPRQTIPSLVSDVTPPQAALTNDAVRWVGPRNTVPVLR